MSDCEMEREMELALQTFIDLEKIYMEKRQKIGLESLKEWAPQNAQILYNKYKHSLFTYIDQNKDIHSTIIGKATLDLKHKNDG